MAETAARRSTILFVCTGNVCRSPYMEYQLREMLAGTGARGLPIASAGTRALRGYPMAEFLTERLHTRGVDATDFRSTQLTRETLEQAGIVVTATREHRTEVVRYGNELAARTFTLAQLARLLSVGASYSAERRADGQPVSAADVASAAVAARGLRAGSASIDDDLDDPWQRSRRTYRRVADRIDELLLPVANRLVSGG